MVLQPLWKTRWRFLRKLKIDTVYGPAIPFLGIHPKEMKTGYERDIRTPMLPAALFTIAKVRQQPKRPKTDKWIKKLRCIYTTEYYPAMVKKDIMSLASRMDLEHITLSVISQRKTSTMWYYLYAESTQAKLIKTESRKVVSRGWAWEGQDRCFRGQIWNK